MQIAIKRIVLRLLFQFFEPQKTFYLSSLLKSIIWPNRFYPNKNTLQCVFISIPKSAGISISSSLFGGYVKGHRSIREYQHLYSSAFLKDCFKFCFVRNPWDRLVSAFFYLKGGGMNRWDTKWAELNLSAFDDFDSFVLGWVNKENIMSWFHFVPQYHYICLADGQMPMDFIGCFENLEADFSFVCDRLNIKNKLLRLNTSKVHRDSYQKYYTKQTRQIVAEVYAEDIQLLGYSFEPSLPAISSRFK